jgi:hypothetical protein
MIFHRKLRHIQRGMLPHKNYDGNQTANVTKVRWKCNVIFFLSYFKCTFYLFFLKTIVSVLSVLDKALIGHHSTVKTLLTGNADSHLAMKFSIRIICIA